MDSIQNVLNVVKKDAFMPSIDLKDVFYSVPVAEHHQKCLKPFSNEYLKFKYIPNGYGPAMRIFIKITKVQFSVLRMQGHTSVVYVDNSYLQGDSYESCLKNVNDTIIMLRLWDFTTDPEKPALKPTETLIYIGFITNSKDMTLKLTEEKKHFFFNFVPNFWKHQKPQFNLLHNSVAK